MVTVTMVTAYLCRSGGLGKSLLTLHNPRPHPLDLLAGPLNLTAYGQPSTAGPAGEPNSYSIIPQGSPASSGSLWGAQIATTTQVAAGTAVVMSVKAGAGIFWRRLGLIIFFNPWSLLSSNEYFWVAEERIAYACPRPAAVNIVTGLPTS
jgi:hypothetical protein